MKKFIFSSLATALFISSSFVASAQTSTVNQLQTLIESLKKQVAELQAKTEAQKKATIEVREAAQDVKETLNLIRQLRQGMSGEDVKTLQILLAADPEIFPEGKITGFFGALTSNAVKRFQKKHGLSQVGNVGPKTLEKLNQSLEKNKLGEEKDERGQKRACAIVPPGHLIAPGWLRKNAAPIVPACQVLPPGIAKKLATTTPPTPTPDTVAPVLSAISATNASSSSVHIVWTTNEAATSKVWYSVSAPVSATGTTPMVSSGNLVTSHDLTISGLNATTTYYFVVESSDAAGNKSVSSESSFATTN